MDTMRLIRFLLILVFTGLFYFSEGKPCPEKTQPHKSRCDAFYKCRILPSKAQVWIPEKCEQGLIYEPSLGMCVLPGDDWECNLDDTKKSGYSTDENVINGKIKDKRYRSDYENDQNKFENDSENSDENTKELDYITVDSESYSSERDFESSGDGEATDYILLDTISPESKTNEEMAHLPVSPVTSKIDPSLTAHLQRLTQLIDGLKQTYQNKDKDSTVSELRPDQLNAFLAHYNIKSQLDSLNPMEEEKPENFNGNKVNIIPDNIQNKVNQSDELSTTTPSNSELDPETKLVLTNHIPISGSFPRPTNGYSNSQIVVNKPEGSVLFSLGSRPQDNSKYAPNISEDTLKTVLELSKQMIENQNVRQIIPNSAYYPQVVQPIYLPPPVPEYSNSIFNQQDVYEDKKYDKVSSTYYVSQRKPSDKPGNGNTIIHNNVLITSSSDEKNEQLDSYGQKINSYPPSVSDYPYFSEVSPEVQDHNHGSRYENNQLVTIRPNAAHVKYNNYLNRHSLRTTTTPRPYIPQTGSTLIDFYTPSPHLDESNVNNVFQLERYPTINYGAIPGRPKRPSESSYFVPQKQYNYNNFRPNKQSLAQLFPSSIDPSKVKIRPNSQKLESMEQEAAENIESESENDQSMNDDNYSETYNQYNANNKFMASQLAQYVEQQKNNAAQVYENQQSLGQNEDESQMSNLFGYDYFKRKLLPTVSYENPKPELNNCPVGIRQPNVTECTRYYVCSKEDGRVMQYSCPSYTAFNPQTKICDAKYYAICHPSAVLNRYTISENQRIQIEAIKALEDAKRIRDEALRAQNIALRLRLGESDRPDDNKGYFSSSTQSPDIFSSYVGSSGSEMNKKYPSSSTQRPQTNVTKKRKYYCKEGDKVADQTSIYNYFVCYKNSQGVMKGHKMKCSEGLMFCSSTSMCTLPRKCL